MTTTPWTDQGVGRDARTLGFDRILFVIVLAHLPITMFLIPMGYGTGQFAILSSLLVGVLAVASYLLLRGTPAFGLVSGILLMILSAIMIQSQLGRIEMHFHIFVVLALLLLHRNWINILVAAAVIAVHHLLLTALQLNAASIGSMPIMVFNYGCSWSIAFLHAAFVVFEGLMLIYYAILMKRDERIAATLVGAVSSIDRDNDLTRRIQNQPKSEAVDAFNHMIQKFAGLTRDVSNAATRISSVSREIDDIAQAAEGGISAQHAQTEQAATAITEMSHSIAQVAENTRSAADVAALTNEKALDGHERFNRAVRSTTDLQQVMIEASESIRRLESNAVTIGSVVDVIRGISEQTNLLALNAAIEAARAGEYGRGFAVVADEVRTLAQRTQTSTTEIQEMIQSIQRDIESSVAKTDYGQRKTTETSSDILQAGLALNEILESVARISEMNAQIAQAVDQQSEVAEGITSNIVSISAYSREVLDKARTNLASAATLKGVAESLGQVVARYRH